MNREIKIGDWGWFWDDDPEDARFDKLTDALSFSGVIKYCRGYNYYFTNFSHDHPTGRFIVTENPNTASNDPYAEFMEAEKNGKTIQFKSPITDDWIDVVQPIRRYGFEILRIKPKPQYRPYTWEDREEFKGKWVRFKPNTKIECAIIRITEDDVFIEGEGIISYEDALSRYEYIDGSPFGKLIEE